MSDFPAPESCMVICQNLPDSFPLGCLSQFDAPAICRVANGWSVVAAARQMAAVSLIVIGMDSSDLDAPAICRALREAPATAAIPVCVVAQASLGHRRLEVLEAGASEFLCAPWHQDEVALRLRRYWRFQNGSCQHASQEYVGAMPRGGGQHDLVWATQQYLAQCLERVPDQRELARLMGVPESRLKAAFYEILGVSVYEYLHRRNMVSAVTLLRESRLRMADIAEMCGYSNAANFATAFRERMGMTPSACRAQGHAVEGARVMPFTISMAISAARIDVGPDAGSRRCPVPLWNKGPISVLVASDRPQDLEPALSELRSQLFDVTIVQGGWDAYNRALTAMPCVLVIDAEMDAMDSMTLCRLVLHAGLSPRMGVIMVCRNNEARLRIAALQSGGLEMLPLPLDAQELMLRIAAHRRVTLRNCQATPVCRIRGKEATPASSVLQALLDMIDRNGGIPGRIKPLAKRIGISERRLGETFKAEMGEPLAVYLRRMRIVAACRLLSGTMIPIKEISAQVGFRSPCNFTVAFQQGMGMSPSRYREESARAGSDTDIIPGTCASA